MVAPISRPHGRPSFLLDFGSFASGSARPYFYMVASALIFALMGALSRGLADRCDWRVVAGARAGLAFLFSASLALLSGTSLVWLRPRTLWVRSLAGSASLVLTFFALPRLPVGDTLTLTNIFPLWIAVLSWPMLGQRPSRAVWISIAVGLAGVALIQRPHFAEGNLATLAALAASGTTAVAMLGLNRLGGVAPTAIVVHFSLVATAAAGLSMLVGDSIAAPTGGWLTGLMLLGVGASATAGQMLMTRAFTAEAASKVAVVALTQVVFGIGFDIICWGRALEPITLVGTALVLAPTAWLLAGRRPQRGRGQSADNLVIST